MRRQRMGYSLYGVSGIAAFILIFILIHLCDSDSIVANN
jgi:hypothetical protein